MDEYIIEIDRKIRVYALLTFSSSPFSNFLHLFDILVILGRLKSGTFLTLALFSHLKNGTFPTSWNLLTMTWHLTVLINQELRAVIFSIKFKTALGDK